jgi:hypothetical protein
MLDGHFVCGHSGRSARITLIAFQRGKPLLFGSFEAAVYRKFIGRFSRLAGITITAGLTRIAVTAGLTRIAVTAGLTGIAVTAGLTRIAITAGLTRIAITAGLTGIARRADQREKPVSLRAYETMIDGNLIGRLTRLACATALVVQGLLNLVVNDMERLE